MPFDFTQIEGVHVVLELRSSNQYVGTLLVYNDLFHFEYDQAYLLFEKAIPLGPEMPLSRKIYQSDQLFRPFVERIPSKENPAYPDYCRSTGISIDEKNPLVLLSTIASRGPSSFLFKPMFCEEFTGSNLNSFRENLGLSIREFASSFDFAYSSIVKTESGKGGRDVLKRAEIYAKYPKVALDQLRRRDGILHQSKMERAVVYLTGLL